MSEADWAGGVVVALAAVLLATHYRSWQELRRAAAEGGPAGTPSQLRVLRRRTCASSLMALIGTAIMLNGVVPVHPGAVTAYLFGLLAAVVALAVLGVVDYRDLRNRHHRDALAALRQELAEPLPRRQNTLADSRGSEN
ncbi:MAG: hypothetical protein KF847_03250 [Pirellulales bacterium]|nr:hypothetical protein [Pirellulales bacterium]